MLTCTRVSLIALMLCCGCSAGTTIHDAASQGDVARIRQLVAEHPSSIQQRDRRGYMPLHSAVFKHQVEATAVLLELGAEIDSVEIETRMTPLELARVGAGPH